MLQQRKQVAGEVAEILDAHPLAGVLPPLEIGNASGFTSSGHLAAYAGIAPVTRSTRTPLGPATAS